jgi:hypothetical protein
LVFDFHLVASRIALRIETSWRILRSIGWIFNTTRTANRQPSLAAVNFRTGANSNSVVPESRR